VCSISSKSRNSRTTNDETCEVTNGMGTSVNN
jgi:hypothetical protein